MKVCFVCKIEKNDFSLDKRNKDGLQGTCNECCNERRRRKYENDIGYRQRQLNRQRKYLEYANEKAKKHIQSLSDTYIIAELKRNTTLTTEDIRKHPELIELKRFLLIQKRIKYDKSKEENQ